MSFPKIIVSFNGCDDSTYIALHPTEQEMAYLRFLQERVNDHAKSGCQPNMEITPWDEAREWERKAAEPGDPS